MFVAYYCEGCSAAPLTQYKNNIKQGLAKEKYYSWYNSDERLCIDMRSQRYTDELGKLARDDGGLTLTIKLKQAAAKKIRLRVIAYSQVEHWYTSTNKGYITTYKDFGIAKDDDITA